jgi:LPPG:FO 2-phospho-L-lactate transferase
MHSDASAPVIVLAGGTGGAKLARGMLDVVGEDLVVVANTGDDLEIYGAHVAPDPDLCAYWLADRIDARGWGLAGDTFAVMDGLRELGADVWFNLGDRDLAVGLRRAQRLADGVALTEALAELTAALGTAARVLPMADAPVRTAIRTGGRWLPFQEFFIRERAAAPIEDVRFDGVEAATPPAAVLTAIATARAIVVGPSNPVISIGPILAVPGLRAALRDGRALTGPTREFLAWAGVDADAAGIAAYYGDLLDGLVSDEAPEGIGVALLQTDTRLADPQARRRVASEVLRFTEALAA